MPEDLRHWHDLDTITTLLEDYRALCATNVSVHHLPNGPEYNRLYHHEQHLLRRVNAVRRRANVVLRTTTSPLVMDLGAEVMQLLPPEVNERTTHEGELDPFFSYAIPLSARPIQPSPVWDKSQNIQTLLHSVLAYAPESFYGQRPTKKKLSTRIRGTTHEDRTYFREHPDFYPRNDYRYIVMHLPQWRVDITAETVHMIRKWRTRPVGNAVYDIFPDSIDLHELRVDARERNKGVGSDLLEHALSSMHAACNRLIVTVDEERLDIQTYLRRMGFYARGVDRAYLEDRDGYVFQKRKIDRSEARKQHALQHGIFVPADGSLKTSRIRYSPF